MSKTYDNVVKMLTDEGFEIGVEIPSLIRMYAEYYSAAEAAGYTPVGYDEFLALKSLDRNGKLIQFVKMTPNPNYDPSRIDLADLKKYGKVVK